MAVVAPAGPVPERALRSGVRELESLGFQVRLGSNVLARKRYLAGDDAGRAVDLLSLWANRTIRAVFAARGGYGSARIVDGLTPGFLRRHPKVFCGFSDLTTVHAACARARLVSFYGPMVAWDLGGRRPKGAASSRGYDAASFRAVLMEGSPVPLAPRGVTSLVRGRASGRLAGGCLTLLVSALGTPEAIDTRGTLLILEDEAEAPYRIDRMLTQLRRAGALDEVRGIVLGDFPGCDPPQGSGYSLRDVLEDRLADLGVPIVHGFPTGHTRRPVVTLPLGVRATLDATRGTLTLEEPAVR